MGFIKIIGLLFLLAYIEAMPLNSTDTDKSAISESWPLGVLDWGKNIRVCGSDLTAYMNIICKINYSAEENEDDTYITKSDFQKLADECCKNCCTSKTIKRFCLHKSTTTRIMITPPITTSESTTTPEPTPTTKKIVPLSTVLRDVYYNYTFLGLLAKKMFPATRGRS